jgi:uncharacterized repeat protein (TIGR01451 family)
VEAYADGPDLDPDPDPYPDPCNDAYDQLTKGVVDILIPSLTADKIGTVKDADNNIYGPGEFIPLPAEVKYPIDITYDILVENDGEIDFPDVTVSDMVLENLLNGIPPGIVINCLNPPPVQGPLPIAGTVSIQCVVTLDDFAEAQLLATNDILPVTADKIENLVEAIQPQFDPDPICGPVPEQNVNDQVVIGIVPSQGEIPALDWMGIAALIIALSGLIIWRSVRGS